MNIFPAHEHRQCAAVPFCQQMRYLQTFMIVTYSYVKAHVMSPVSFDELDLWRENTMCLERTPAYIILHMFQNDV